MIRPTHWWLPLRIRTADALFWLLVVAILLTVFSSITFAQTCPDGNCPTGNCPPTWNTEAGRNSWQPSQIAQSKPPAFACKVIAYRGREAAPGSGILIRRGDDFGLVLSCAHGPRDATRHEVIFPSTGERFAATEVAVNRGRDTALLRTAGRPSMLTATLGKDLPQPGEKIYSGGWGMPERGEQWAAHPGYYIGQEDSKTDRGLFGRLMAWRGRMRLGDSGGPVWNQRGELIGINTATSERDGRSVGPGIDAIVEILVQYDDACAPAVDVVVEPAPPIPDTDLQDQIDALREQIDALAATPGAQGPPGPPGPPGAPAEPVDIDAIVTAIVEQLPPPRAPDIDEIVAGVIARLPIDDAPLFFVVHRDPETGEIIPQTDPTTGATYTVQPINRGDDWTIYLPPQSQPGDD